MAQATAADIQKLEEALMQQFYALVQGAKFRINLARMGDPTKPLSENEKFVEYDKMFQKLVNKWLQREAKYEVQLLKHGSKGIIAAGDIHTNDFYYSSALPKLDMLIKKYDATPASGIGWVSALIWAVSIIVGLFELKEIADDYTVTTEERQQLMETTKKTCEDLNLTPEQCTTMITNTQKEASSGTGGLGDIFKWLALAAGAIFILPKVLSSTSKT